MAAAALLGPPEIYKFTTDDDVATSPATTTTVEPEKHVSPTYPNDPFMDSLVANFNRVGLGLPPMGLTENNSATFLSSGDACLDFFFQVVPDTRSEVLVSILEASWKKDPLTSLKLVCNLRGVRGTGKCDKEGFYTAALWLHQHHPKTLALNVRSMAEFGYLKDLLEILHRLLHGADFRRIIKKEREEVFLARRIGKKVARSRRMVPYCMLGRIRGGRRKKANKEKKAEEQMWEPKETREEVIAAEKQRAMIRMERASLLRKKKKVELAKKALNRYHGDEDFRFLHDQIADYFAGLLIADLELLKSGKRTEKISLAAKWCPSIDSSFDKSTLLCESIARRVFPRDRYPEYDEVEEEHYAYRVRDRLRKEVLVPLRKFLELPEIYMTANKWNSLPYNHVPSVAMKNYKKIFKEHDGKRFDEYLQQVSAGTAKIAAGALLPHEIVAEACKDDEVAELQWKRMVNDLSEKGKLRNCIAVCDVSGSMGGTPMEVCVALGLLTSELSEEPWKGKVITFSANPQLHLITGDTLSEKASFVEKMDWGSNTDLQKVFDRILQVAVEGKLPPEKMIKKVFVFSDMEFDQASAKIWETNYVVAENFDQASANIWETNYVVAEKFDQASANIWETNYMVAEKFDQASANIWETNYMVTENKFDQASTNIWEPDSMVTENKFDQASTNSWETDYMVIEKKFKENGYGSAVPEIVFWNLRDSRSTPVPSRQKGVALVSGFSKNLMTLFLQNDGILSPLDAMEAAIAAGEYQNLKVFD